MLGLRFCARAFSSCGKWGTLFIAVRGPLLLRSTGSRRAGSVAVAHGPSHSAACGILPDQGSNPCPPHWQADSQPLRHQGSPQHLYFYLTIMHKCHQIYFNKITDTRPVQSLTNGKIYQCNCLFFRCSSMSLLESMQ